MRIIGSLASKDELSKAYGYFLSSSPACLVDFQKGKTYRLDGVGKFYFSWYTLKFILLFTVITFILQIIVSVIFFKVNWKALNNIRLKEMFTILMYILHIDSITKQYEIENLILVEHNEWFHVPLNCSFKYSAIT